MAEAPASCRRAGDRWSNTGGRARSDDGKSRADRIIQPSNGGVTQSNEPPTNPGPFIPAEPGYTDAGYELKAMDCIAKNAERDDVRRLFGIEVR